MIAHVKPTARVPAVQGQFGPRLLTYTTQLPAGSLETIIGHDPRSRHWKRLPQDLSNMYEHLQRKTSKSRLESLVRYIRFRFIERPTILGAFPALAIAVQNPTPFVGIEQESGLGVLHFDLSQRNRRLLVDGLGRASAALELLEHSEDIGLAEDVREAIKKVLSEFTLPTVFYLPANDTPPLSLEEMQQLFHDFNFRVTPVKESLAIALDHSDVYIALANHVGDSDLIKGFGGMERKAPSLGSKSSAIVVQQTLLRFVRAATEGSKFADATNNSDLSDPNLTDETLDHFESRILSFLHAFSEGMGAEKFRNRDSLHLSAPGWTVLGILFNDLDVRLKVPDLEASAKRLGSLDWNKSAPIWSEVVKPKTNKAGETSLGLLGGGGGQNRRLMTNIVRRELKIDSLLRERGMDEDDLPASNRIASERPMPEAA